MNIATMNIINIKNIIIRKLGYIRTQWNRQEHNKNYKNTIRTRRTQ